MVNSSGNTWSIHWYSFIIILLDVIASLECGYEQGLIKGEKFCFRYLDFYFQHGESTSTASQLTSPASQKSKDINKVSILAIKIVRMDKTSHQLSSDSLTLKVHNQWESSISKLIQWIILISSYLHYLLWDVMSIPWHDIKKIMNLWFMN